MARRWFEVMRGCGDEVREVLHDGCPVACLGDVPFGYVNVFTAHVNVGFFQGAGLRDPEGLLEGTGKFMRHVKLRVGEEQALGKKQIPGGNDRKKSNGKSEGKDKGKGRGGAGSGAGGADCGGVCGYEGAGGERVGVVLGLGVGDGEQLLDEGGEAVEVRG